MPAPDIIKQLVARFEEHREAYRSGKYNETQLRREFLDPFFEALGWDILNKQGYAEAYKDVIHEDSLLIEGENKAPDYAFRTGGIRKFFVEAKKPAVNIEMNIHPAFQLRRYAWSAKLPLSILTDFEEFAVYDCRLKPDKGDKASTGRVKLLSYKEYVEKWDEIAAVFSQEAVLKGSFDEYAEGLKSKKGTTEVDDAFLAEIERWRELLARNIALRNPNLSVRELNYAVQMTIDRIVFLRICEDRGIERDEQLKDIASGKDVYASLSRLFQQADARYNSGLFHFRAEKDQHSPVDSFTLDLKIDDKVLQDILKNLYYPESPYVFREIPSDILGQVYERFLGKVIRLTAGHQAKVEEKPDVRKAGGVYYTPTYIVDYIVQNTVGRLVEGKTPEEVAKLKILDPACGSGTFLLGAYQYLLDWHTDWYGEHDPQKWARGKKPVLFQVKDGWQLTVQKKKEILLNNIFGVDIDPQAVEVTKLSLLLKVLETPGQLDFMGERVLPDLGKNIQCGNSLIGFDYFDGKMFVEQEERERVNAFDWKGAFSQVFAQGGFDAVIGNPPYVLGRETFDEHTKQYLSKKYIVYGGKYDLYIYFTERAIALLRASGKLGYIIPNTVLVNVNASKLRKVILDETQINIIRVFDERVFEHAQVESVIIVTGKKPTASEPVVIQSGNSTGHISQDSFANNPDYRFNVRSNSLVDELITRIESKSNSLGMLSDICIGIQLGGSSGTDKKESFISDSQVDEAYKKVLDGKDINTYVTNRNNKFVRYGNWLHRKRDEKYFLNPKILIRQIGAVPIATFDDQNFYTLNTIYNLISISQYSPKFFLGVINSKLGKWFWRIRNSDFKSLFPKIKKDQIENIPIRSINFSDPADKARHDKMVSLVERMLELRKRPAARTPQEQEMVKREIESTDRQIDRLVYELYELTEEEIKIVEGAR